MWADFFRSSVGIVGSYQRVDMTYAQQTAFIAPKVNLLHAVINQFVTC